MDEVNYGLFGLDQIDTVERLAGNRVAGTRLDISDGETVEVWIAQHLNPYNEKEGRPAKRDQNKQVVEQLSQSEMGAFAYLQYWLDPKKDGKGFPIRCLYPRVPYEKDPATLLLNQRPDLFSKNAKGDTKVQTAYRIKVFVKGENGEWVEKIWVMTAPLARKLNAFMPDTFEEANVIGQCLKLRKEKGKGGFSETTVTPVTRNKVDPKDFPPQLVKITEDIGGADVEEVLQIMKNVGIEFDYEAAIKPKVEPKVEETTPEEDSESFKTKFADIKA